MNEKKYTTMLISKELRNLLNGLKIHPNQSYDEVVRLLIKHYRETTSAQKELKRLLR